jgi:hypothetical protein
MTRLKILNVPTPIHGRVLIRDAAVDPFGLIVGFHGYGQRAEDMLEDLERVPGIDRWRIASVQALHRFYSRDQQKVIGSWMTGEDRELAIADNVEYVNRVIDQVQQDQAQGPGPKAQVNRQSAAGTASASVYDPDAREAGSHLGLGPWPLGLIFVGFSQGASMAYRAALLGAHRASGLIALGGDIPPEVRAVPALSWPRVLIGAGVRDEWFGKKVGDDVEFLLARGVAHEVVHFDGGHEWTDEFRRAVAAFLSNPGAETRR